MPPVGILRSCEERTYEKTDFHILNPGWGAGGRSSDPAAECAGSLEASPPLGLRQRRGAGGFFDAL